MEQGFCSVILAFRQSALDKMRNINLAKLQNKKSQLSKIVEQSIFHISTSAYQISND
jgi:hypothetical protein